MKDWQAILLKIRKHKSLWNVEPFSIAGHLFTELPLHISLEIELLNERGQELYSLQNSSKTQPCEENIVEGSSWRITERLDNIHLKFNSASLWSCIVKLSCHFFAGLPPSLELTRNWNMILGCGSLLFFFFFTASEGSKISTQCFWGNWVSPFLCYSFLWQCSTSQLNNIFSWSQGFFIRYEMPQFDCRGAKSLNSRLDNKQNANVHTKCYTILV